MPEIHLYPAAMEPQNPSEADGTPNRILGTVFYSDVDTYVVALEWFTPTTLPAFCSMSLWTLTGDNPLATTGTRSDLATFTVAGMTPGAWNRIDLPTERFLAADRPMYVQVHTDGHYVYSNPGDFPFDSDDGTLHAYAAIDSGNGRWTNSGDNSNIANTNMGSGDGYNFFVGVITNTDLLDEISATFDLTLPVPAPQFEAASAATASLNINLPATIADVDAGAVASAALDINLPEMGTDAETQAVAGASFASVLPVIGSAAEAINATLASFDITLPDAVGFAAEAVLAVDASFAMTLPSAVAAAAEVIAPATTTFAVTVPPQMAIAAEAETPADASFAVVLPSPVAAATALRSIDATLAILLPAKAAVLYSLVEGDETDQDEFEGFSLDGTETVVVIRPPGRDAFGDLIAGAAPEHDEPGCLFAPGSSQEQNFAANTVDTDGTIYAPAGADFLATDQVRIRGETYSVVGKPQVWGGAGMVVAVRRVTG